MPEDTESQDIVVPRATEPKFLTEMRFSDLDLPSEILAGLDKAGFTYCTPIQSRVLPVALTGQDVAGQAQTGTGKTAAFLVTLFARFLADPKKATGLPSGLVVAPTRELAFQIYEEAMLLGSRTGLRFAQVVGGVDYQKQAEILKKGTDIVICTPGRIIDYYKQGIFRTEAVSGVVIDEADRLLDLGFAKDMRFILQKLPHYEKRQSMLFSATLSHRVMELTYEYMNLPEFIAVAPEEITVEGIDQSLYHVGADEKLSLLLGLFEREDWSRALIFVNTRVGVQWLTQKLKGNRLPAEGITGDLPQTKRFELMKRYKEGSIKILIATDVASRGIHVEDISHVFNYDLPQDPENYIHRIGRTARAGKTGSAISFACEKYVYHLPPLEEMIGCNLPVVWPEEDWFKEDKSGPVSVRQKRQAMKTGRPPADGRRRPQGGRPSPVRARAQGRPRTPDRPRANPGAFFGFGPTPAAEKEAEPTADKKGPSRRRGRRSRSRTGAASRNNDASPPKADDT